MSESRLPRMLSIHDASQESGMSEAFIRGLVRHNEVPFVRSGAKYYINSDALREVLNSQTQRRSNV